MSKAFTREDDAADPIRPAPVSLLPPGVKNYLTPEGRDRLQAELNRLLEERPVLVEGSLTDPELRGELAQLDQRIQYLERGLATAEVVPPAKGGEDRVRFGSTVTVRDSRGTESTYRLVGVDETDPERNEISWRSPIATALLNARQGQRVPFRFPSGATELEIIAIR
jgi:transcription elongation factor GreB